MPEVKMDFIPSDNEEDIDAETEEEEPPSDIEDNIQEVKLKFAREKAMISRKKNAKERAEAKSLDKEEKELLTKQKVKRVKKLKEEVDEPEVPKVLPIKEPVFSKKDLEEAQLEAIMKYDVLRKQRKKEKQTKAVEDKVEQDFRDELRRAVTPSKPSNPYHFCY